MRSDVEPEIDVKKNIQQTLFSIRDVTLKITKELDMIGEIVKDNGDLQVVVAAANRALAEKTKELHLNMLEIINESEREDRVAPDLLNSTTFALVMEKLMENTGA
ncbi:PREDICTED: uncharacterized protein LOC105566828 [Vollenhovia emeryi]|uniref:uncharacterized protein LOC105566828 n=1 Tax=Vollenhovia emeryi TaxID=411798 RepID=UPI0005F4E536|nr:PREDICTED: uncharacterized protein LOC105566828 [Vollenhovia emeryi]